MYVELSSLTVDRCAVFTNTAKVEGQLLEVLRDHKSRKDSSHDILGFLLVALVRFAQCKMGRQHW